MVSKSKNRLEPPSVIGDVSKNSVKSENGIDNLNGKASSYETSTGVAQDIAKHGKISYINRNEEDEMEIYGYRRSIFGTIITWFFILITVGILRLVFHWFPEMYLKSTHTPCSLETAERVLIVEIYQLKLRRVHIRNVTEQSAKELLGINEVINESNQVATISLPNGDGTFRDADSMRLFTCKKLRYIWNTTTKEFVKIRSLGPGMSTASMHYPEAQLGMAGLSPFEQLRRRVVYGCNVIYVPVKSIMQLLLLEVLNPFYIFQMVAIVIWVLIDYWQYAIAIFLMSATGVIITISQTRKNQRKLRDTVRDNDIIEVCRGQGKFETIETQDLVPGDIIVIPSSGIKMYCDAVLLFGTCIVNESMLTGESVPVTKVPLPQSDNIKYHPKEHARHTLFSGTKVVQTRFYNDEKVMAVVTSTGFLTAKGSLVSAIMYPPPADFRFERDSYKFIAFLASIATVGFIYSIVTMIVVHGETSTEVIFHAFDMITVCVPPALPAAMTAGIILAQKRLQLKNIFCISPRAINVSGSINCICFDKTGTLTEDGLDLWGVVPVLVKLKKFLLPIKNPSTLPQAILAVTPQNESSVVSTEPPLLMVGMATCHSLTIIDGALSGDPLDLKMFESTGWDLEEPTKEDSSKYDSICPTIITWKPNKTENSNLKVEVGIVRQFTFSSALQRMGVLCKRIGVEQQHPLDFFCKGSPEMVKSLSKPETVPENFDEILEEYTKQGFRVIALAHRCVEFRSINKLQKVQREELEKELTFLGLVILENRLKPDTTQVISQLIEADMRTIMVTGDNLLTAISVARDCGMIGTNDQVVIINFEESKNGRKPRISYDLAEKASSVQDPEFVMSTSITNDPIVKRLDEISLEIMPEWTERYHLAMTGKCWAVLQEHYPELVHRCVVKGTIFARMSPDQKQELVQELQQLGYYVGMCGDGANDCGALKTAHAGIALSDTEASIASPFTSREPSISCVPELIRQGRCSLVTSFGIFKYMAMYSLIQFVSCMMLYEFGLNLSDFQFLYVDLFMICSISAVFGYTQPYRGPLCKRPPLTSLLSLPPLGSLIIQGAVVIFFQVFSYLILTQQDWFVPYMDFHNETGIGAGDLASAENYAIVCMSFCQYIFLALAFSKGYPYRKMFITNYWFVGVLAACTGFSTYLIVGAWEPIADWFQLMYPPDMYFRYVILILSAVQIVACLLIEAFVVDKGLIYMAESEFWLKLRPRKEKHLAIEKELLDPNINWPVINRMKQDDLEGLQSPEAPPIIPQAPPPPPFT